MANRAQRRPDRVRTRSIGVHGPLIMGALYRLGCATAEELAAILRLDRRKVNRQLLTLLGDGYVERLCAWPSWRKVTRGGPPHVYYLSSRLGVPCGAGEVGVEDEDEARSLYRRCRIPAHYSHRELGTAFVAQFSSACRVHTGITFTDYWAEHAPDFPWRAGSYAPTYVSGLGPGLKQGDIRPDGLAQSEIDFGGDIGLRRLRMVLNSRPEAGTSPMRSARQGRTVRFLRPGAGPAVGPNTPGTRTGTSTFRNPLVDGQRLRSSALPTPQPPVCRSAWSPTSKRTTRIRRG